MVCCFKYLLPREKRTCMSGESLILHHSCHSWNSFFSLSCHYHFLRKPFTPFNLFCDCRFLLATAYTHHDNLHFFFNFGFLALVMIPKIPNMQGVSFFFLGGGGGLVLRNALFNFPSSSFMNMNSGSIVQYQSLLVHYQEKIYGCTLIIWKASFGKELLWCNWYAGWMLDLHKYYSIFMFDC